ncbi:myb-like protein X [Solanum tuberosum]|uniref:Glutamic acid reigh protein n=1 Tax=Solanum tuberosum TaxID=4113 RepID=M1DAW9_SOLTU|nr:PREDICTED: myb-like protein X [Solanum tuberosum]
MLPENGGISSSSSPIPDPAPPKANSLETELLCDESFSEIIKEEVEEEVVSSDSLNERKRLRTVEEEEEDGTEAVSDSNKSRRIHEDKEEEEKGPNEIDEQNGNQDSEQSGNQESEVADEKDGGNEENNEGAEESEQKEGREDGDKEEEEKETEGGNQVNNNGEEDQNEEDETEEVEKEDETEELPQFSTAEEEGENHDLEEHRENVGGEDNVNRVNSEQNEEEEKETEEQKQKAAEKGKRPLFEEDEEEEQKQQAAKKWQKTSLIPITPIFSKFLRGESSHRTKGDQIQNSTPKVDTELVDIEINTDNNKGYDYHRDLAILKAMYDFKFINGYLPYPHSDELHNHIMDLMPDLNILGNDLTVKITAFEDDFNTVIILDGDNPEMAQPVEREIFDLSMQLWGNSDDNVGDGI